MTQYNREELFFLNLFLIYFTLEFFHWFIAVLWVWESLFKCEVGGFIWSQLYVTHTPKLIKKIVLY